MANDVTSVCWKQLKFMVWNKGFPGLPAEKFQKLLSVLQIAPLKKLTSQFSPKYHYGIPKYDLDITQFHLYITKNHLDITGVL
jgi:hypothetical protein